MVLVIAGIKYGDTEKKGRKWVVLNLTSEYVRKSRLKETKQVVESFVKIK